MHTINEYSASQSDTIRPISLRNSLIDSIPMLGIVVALTSACMYLAVHAI
jgi:hypothetical protein